MPEGIPRICREGHRYYKSSDCPTCPHCEAARTPASDLLAGLAAPARRALESINVRTTAQLARYTEAEILALHGMGPSSLPALRKALRAAGRKFKNGS